jgi:glycosyltransferase involved in cell wall biosynthesis
MRVVMVSKALVTGAYQRKAEEIARLGVDLTALVPPVWGDRRGRQRLERAHTQGYTLRESPVRFGGNFHLHYYPALGRELARLRPDLLHMDEEPYNLATWLGMRAAQRLGIPALFFTWQNICRPYPPPFRRFEQDNYRRAAHAIAGSEGAAAVLRAKGCAAPITVLPQFGVDPALFSPAPDAHPPGARFRIGYAGGLLPEKGVDLLLRACAGLQGEWRLHLAGGGGEEAALRRLARDLGVAERVHFAGRLSSTQMPDFYGQLDALALPSRTTPAWKEQFGRVLIEAMACAVPVVGSDSGEIPHVIGDAGLLFPKDDVDALCAQLQRLADDAALRARLGEMGRQRVLERYTMARIAEETVAVYARVLGEQRGCEI